MDKTVEWINYITKNWPAFLLLLAGIIAVISTFVATTQDSRQKDNIEMLAKENRELTKNIELLTKLNSQISSRIEILSESNRELSQKNLFVSKRSGEIVEKVHILSENISDLIERVDQKTQYSYYENLVSGELKVDFRPVKSDTIHIHFGTVTLSHTLSSLIGGSNGTNILPIKFRIDNGLLLFSLRVVDLDGNLIAEIEENKWRPNRNIASKVNYDDHGLEIINNRGEVAFSIDIKDGNSIYIKGIFPSREARMILIAGKSLINAVLDPRHDYTDLINEAVLVPIFRYTGADWLHKRK